jgi:hypothetical protein
MDTFEYWWNKEFSFDYIIFDTHGNPFRIGIDGDERTPKDKLWYNEVDNLYFREIKFLILLACNAGHLDWWQYRQDESIVASFAQKVSGCVVASDGTVNSYSTFYNGFKSVTSDSFKQRSTECGKNRTWFR